MDEGLALATVLSRPEENGNWASLHDIIASTYCPSRFRTSKYLSSQNSGRQLDPLELPMSRGRGGEVSETSTPTC